MGYKYIANFIGFYFGKLSICWRLFVFYKVSSLRKGMFLGQQRYVSQYFVFDFFALSFKLIDYLLDFYQVPI